MCGAIKPGTKGAPWRRRLVLGPCVYKCKQLARARSGIGLCTAPLSRCYTATSGAVSLSLRIRLYVTTFGHLFTFVPAL